MNDVKDDTEKLDILADKDEDKDSGNDSDEIQTSPEPERESLIQTEEMQHIIEAAKPKFSSPVWLDEIQNNKIFNKQKSINKEEELTPKRSNRPFPVRSISEIIDSDSESEDIQESNTNRNNNQSKSNGDVLDASGAGAKLEERKPHQETDLWEKQWDIKVSLELHPKAIYLVRENLYDKHYAEKEQSCQLSMPST